MAKQTPKDMNKELQYPLARAICLAVEKVPHFTDLIIHEGEPIFIKSHVGTVALRQLVSDDSVPEVVSKEDIRLYFSYCVAEVPHGESQESYWNDVVVPTFGKQLSINSAKKMELIDVYLRFNLFMHERGKKLGMVVRVTRPPKSGLDRAIPEELVDRLDDGQKGLLIITGPTASGKTATALSLLKHRSEKQSGHIVSIEDPIEFKMNGGQCVYTQREVGLDVPDFASGLREALRQSPDILLVGEVRDKETAETAILAGESGALVIITTHGSTISGALRKMTYLAGPAMRSVLSGCLIGAIRQSLVPVKDKFEMVSDYLIGSDTKVRNLIETGNWDGIDSLYQEARSESHVSMNIALATLVRQDRISLDSAVQYASNPRAFAKAWGMNR